MPQLYGSRVVEPGQSAPVAPHDPAVVEDASRDPIFSTEPPDQTPRERADERVVQVALAPDRERPTLLLEIQALDPVPLSRQHLLDVPGSPLELFQLLGMMLLDGLRHRLLPLAIRPDPTHFCRARPGDDQLDTELANLLAPYADLLQPVGRHGHLLDLLAWQPDTLGCNFQCRFYALLRLANLYPYLEQRELAYALGTRHVAQSPHAGVTDPHAPRTHLRRLPIRRERQRCQSSRDPGVLPPGAQPDEPFQNIGVLVLYEQ